MVSTRIEMSLSGSNENGSGPGRKRREKRKARPLDQIALRDLALSYVARFATTGAKLESYLARKIRERGVTEDGDGRSVELDVTGLVTDFIEAGYVDDDAYARARTRDLTARGYGARRVEQALWAAGVEEQVRADNAPGEAESRRAAMLLAKKRRFGPFARATEADPDERDESDFAERRKLREKQVAAMLRAGHSFEHTAFIMDAGAQVDVDEWLAEAEDEAKNEERGTEGTW
ncbi:regulatory protein RecX [Erythrobacter sp.]|uniref:regulatory protein RecX n=1 Tax=Erythrobacter sp. TaxID=1042 RepID=UPI003C72C7E8